MLVLESAHSPYSLLPLSWLLAPSSGPAIKTTYDISVQHFFSCLALVNICLSHSVSSCLSSALSNNYESIRNSLNYLRFTCIFVIYISRRNILLGFSNRPTIVLRLSFTGTRYLLSHFFRIRLVVAIQATVERIRASYFHEGKIIFPYSHSTFWLHLLKTYEI